MTAPDRTGPPARRGGVPPVRGGRRRAATLGSSAAFATSLLATALLASSLSGCGGPRALTQTEVAEAVVDAGEIGLAGWVAETPNEVAPGDDGGLSALLQGADGLSEPCRAALRTVTGGLGQPTAFAARGFSPAGPHTGEGADLLIALRGYDEDPPALPDTAAAVRACPTFELTASGQRLSGRLRAATYDVADSTGLALDLTSGEEHTALELAWLRRGANLVTASATGAQPGPTHDLVATALRGQADKLARALT